MYFIIKTMKNNLIKTFYKTTRRFKIDWSAGKSDNAEDIPITPDMMKTIEERKRMMEEQEREQIRKAFEFKKKREEEIAKGNRKMLLDTKVPNVNETPEK
jgi:hypothetical protein